MSVVAADDHPMFRAGVKTVLAADPALKVVDEAADVAGTLRAVREHQPALALDLNILDGSSLPAMGAILEASL